MDQGAALLPPPAGAGQIYSFTAFLALAWRRSCSPVTPLANPEGIQLGEQGALLGRPNPARPATGLVPTQPFPMAQTRARCCQPAEAQAGRKPPGLAAARCPLSAEIRL